MIRGVVFDIDDTLYDERDYVRSGFAHVARAAGGSADESAAVLAWLWRAFESGVRGDTFDRLLAAFPDLARRVTRDELVTAYRGHEPDIALAAGFPDTLDELRRRGLRLGALSDGPAASQSTKARALGLARWLDPIVLTGALAPGSGKPATPGFEQIEAAWSERGAALVYVADNPEKDFIGPRRLGWATVRVRRPAQLRADVEPAGAEARPDAEVATPDALLAWLDGAPGS